MSADELRQAAKTLRGWAEKATPGPWEARHGGDYSWIALYDDEDKIPEGESLPSFEPGGIATSYDATYIATMHPGVGLWLAALLSMMADHAKGRGAACGSCVEYSEAIARLINGGAS